ncbi:MAG: hypothetical protein VYD54_00305 [Bdellovibrionota bacterium]|nr:hypothetical protein [Bdellovibrionota bacterium]
MRHAIVLFLFLSSNVLAGIEDYYMASAFKLKDSAPEFNQFYNGLIRQKLKELNHKRSCSKIVQKLRPVFGGTFKSKKVPLGVLNKLISYFPNIEDPQFFKDIDEKGLYKGLDKVTDLKRIFNIGGVYVGTDKFAHFFEIGGWYYDRYLKKMKLYKKLSFKRADLKARKELVQWGLSLEGTITGKWSKMLSYGDTEANYQGFLFYRSLCHGESPGLQKIDGHWTLVKDLDFRERVTPFLDDSYSLGDYNKRKWKKVRPRLLKLCSVLNEPTYQDLRSSYETFPYEGLNTKMIKRLIQSGQAPRVNLFSLESVCETEGSYEDGGLNSDLGISLPGKKDPKINVKATLIDDRTLNPENIEIHDRGNLISWTGGLLPLYRYFSLKKNDGSWTDPNEEPFSFQVVSLAKKAFSLPIKASSSFVNGRYITGNLKDDIIVTSIMSIHQKRGAFYFFRKKGKDYEFLKKMETKDFNIPGRYGLLKHQRFSKDGKWMTFYARGTQEGSGVYLYNFETKKTFVLSRYNDKHPTFNEEGDKIFFHWQLGGNSTEKSGYDFELSYLGYIELSFFGNNVKWKRVLLDKPKKGVYNYQKHPVPYPGTDLVFSHGRVHPLRGGMKLFVRSLLKPEKKWSFKLSSFENIKLNRTKHPSASFGNNGLYFVGRNKKEKNNRVYFLSPEVIKGIDTHIKMNI